MDFKSIAARKYYPAPAPSLRGICTGQYLPLESLFPYIGREKEGEDFTV